MAMEQIDEIAILRHNHGIRISSSEEDFRVQRMN